MYDESRLDETKFLAMDDEPDVLDIIKEAFLSSIVMTAKDFDSGLKLINENIFDLVILDIIGVNGFELLKACRDRHLLAAKLTSKAIDVENLNQAIREGAVSFLPKEELHRFPEVVAEILGELEEGRTHWSKLFERMGSFFEKKFGPSWKDLETPPYPGSY